MALNLEAKKQIVEQLTQVANDSMSVVALDYRGLDVQEITELRNKAREANVTIKIVRNTLSRRAFESTEFSCLNDVLLGPILLAFSANDPGSAARVVRAFVKEHQDKKIEVRGLSVSGEFIKPEDIGRVADLPTRDEAIAILMSVMKAPVVKLMRTMKEVNGKMVRTVAALAEKKKAEE